jgi:hypothetical protein
MLTNEVGRSHRHGCYQRQRRSTLLSLFLFRHHIRCVLFSKGYLLFDSFDYTTENFLLDSEPNSRVVWLRLERRSNVRNLVPKEEHKG